MQLTNSETFYIISEMRFGFDKALFVLCCKVNGYMLRDVINGLEFKGHICAL